VALTPFAAKTLERLAGFRQLQASLPAVFKALAIQTESDMPTMPNNTGETHGYSPRTGEIHRYQGTWVVPLTSLMSSRCSR
jgi:hypothetical protein